ncbi:helix-turn-helix domain-containing protein [Clostridium sp. SHJSY1]|uniref:helix-turn-helix domain-containing protein n=1 Tax=Clostridium sp. SHJSY1 TaxID=2942483 RepID=UPI002875A96D|nr:helix-turn-helix domain-containing protein [Clostridium sp. SHJSY1]MDS0526070.1 helix-turn-helix domain-containing protein [Clostridium sp. SHJSY1]
MSKMCYICNSEMEKKTTSVNTGWGAYKLTVDGVNAYVCPKCGEVIIEKNDAIMLQKLSKSLVNVGEEQKPDFLNLTEVADLLRVSNQTIYNMIRDGRLKAHKFGREWRFIRKDIESFMGGEEAYDIAARGKSGELNEKDTEIISKYL